MIHSFAELKSLALSLNLPQVTVDYPWGQECLKAHGKMWCWWSSYVDAAVFKCAADMMEGASDPAVKFPVHLAVEGGQGRTWAEAH